MVDSLVMWCEQNHLLLSVAKTKELVVDLRRAKAHMTPVSCSSPVWMWHVVVAEDYKYLGVFLDNKLDWTKNMETLYNKGQIRLYFLWRLRSSNICRTMLRMFFTSLWLPVPFCLLLCAGVAD